LRWQPCGLVEESAVVETGAMAQRRVFQPAADDLSARNGFAQFGELRFSNFAKAVGRVTVVWRCIEEEANIVEAESSALGRTDDGESAYDPGLVAAAATDPLRRRDQTDVLVVTDRGGGLSGSS
jgi:hypothetical protein